MSDQDDDERRPSRQALTKAERLSVFYRELGEAPAAATLDEAIELLGRILLSVEDRLSGIDRGTGSLNDGRMYPALADNRRPVPGRFDIVRFRSKAHNVYYGANGAILIFDAQGTNVLSKPGADGEVIEL